MNKSDTQEMNELSLQVFGKKYYWKKLTKRGVNVGRDADQPHVMRRLALTNDQAKEYMLKTLEMRLKMKESVSEDR